MKKGISHLSNLLLLGILTQCLLAENTYAADYIGEYCWRSTSASQYVYDYKFGIEIVGQGHILLNGYSKFLGSQDGYEPTHGNAEIDGNDVRMTLNRSGASTEGNINLWADTIYVVLSLPNLNGTYKALYQEHDISSDSTEIAYSSGTFTRVACQ